MKRSLFIILDYIFIGFLFYTFSFDYNILIEIEEKKTRSYCFGKLIIAMALDNKFVLIHVI